MIPALLALLLAAFALPPALAQDQDGRESDVVCGATWVTFQLPGIPQGQRGRMKASVANHPVGTVLTIRKADVRNVIYYSDTKGGEIVFRLDTASMDRPTAIYSGLVTEQVYLDVVLCLD